jgi:molecular chaperone IbpA
MSNKDEYNEYYEWKKKGRFPNYPNPYSPNPHDPPFPPHGKEDFKFPSQKPKPLTIADLFPRIDRWGIGVLDTLESFKSIADSKPSYPPYNILKHKDGKWEIELALAGLRKEDIEILVKDRSLTISSEVEPNEDAETFGEVIHHGIAQRNFTLNFALADYVEVDEAIMADGILTVKLVTNIPDEKKPKVIDIK